MIEPEQNVQLAHTELIARRVFAGREHDTEVQIAFYPGMICCSLVDYESGEVLFHADLLTDKGVPTELDVRW